MTATRTEPPFAAAAFADAAYVPRCSNNLLAVQRISPNQPFNLTIARQFQTGLSLRLDRTRRSRKKRTLISKFVDALAHDVCGKQIIVMLCKSWKRSLKSKTRCQSQIPLALRASPTLGEWTSRNVLDVYGSRCVGRHFATA